MKMKRIGISLLSIGVIFGFSYDAGNVAEAKAKVFKNCTELNKTYKGGVAKSASIRNKGGKTRYKPHVSKAIYEANRSKDRDKDGIACER